MSMRGLILTLGIAIVAVLGLDATAIATKPGSQPRAAASITPGQPAQPGQPGLRLLQWSGQTWLVEPPTQPGPDDVRLNDSRAAAYVDSHGRLHLQITKVHGVWRSVQLVALTPAAYGTYHFVTDSSIATLAKPLDLGMFVYRSGSPFLQNEIDLEDSRALIGMHHGLDAQYVVQPYYQPHHIHRYTIAAAVSTTQQQFTWTNQDARFLTRIGSAPDAPVLDRFHYNGPSVPTPYGERLFVDLFLHGNGGQVKSGTRNAVLDSFTFTPAS